MSESFSDRLARQSLDAMQFDVCKVCHECGRMNQGHMASASRGDETRYFCHNDERSCYNDRRGSYFDNDYPKRPELL